MAGKCWNGVLDLESEGPEIEAWHWVFPLVVGFETEFPIYHINFKNLVHMSHKKVFIR